MGDKLKRLIITLSIFVGVMMGQNSSYQVLFTNVTSSTITSPVTNIGQITHQATLQFSNAPSKTCVPSSFGTNAALEYSFDNTNWVAFSYPAGGVNSPITTLSYIGFGTYPRVRFNLSGFDTVNCTATAYYTGSLYSIALPATSAITSFTKEVFVGGANTTVYLPNYGQVSHAIVAVSVLDNGLNTCLASSLTTVTLNGYLASTNALTSVSSKGKGLSLAVPAYGTGVYNSYALVLSGDTTNCAAVVEYIGYYASLPTPAREAASTGLVPINQCNNMVSINSSSPGQQVLGQVPGAIYRVCNVSIFGASAGQTITLKTGTTTTTPCDTNATTLGTYTGIAGSTIPTNTIGSGLGSIFQTNSGICVLSTSGVTGSISYTLGPQ